LAATLPLSDCNICGGADFGFGPGGRLSVTGVQPYCVRCGSLERHRAIRAVFNDLRDASFTGLSVLQFSRDLSVESTWFRKFETSIYEGENSLDLMRIDRPSAMYGLVICNHVLEHVQYDNAALTELLRITEPNGFVFLSFPDPARHDRTSEYGSARPDMHYHWRLYGRDVVERFRRYIPQAYVIEHEARDPVTGAPDVIYVLTTGLETAMSLKNRFGVCLMVNTPPAARSP
jgi:SAM-dependent methyltransferase